MKKEMLAVLMLAGTALLLSAEGKQDQDVQFYGRGSGMMGGYRMSEEGIAARTDYLESLETVSITGPLSLVNGELPSIEQNGSVYTIMAPWYDLADLNLKDGMTVTVEGYKMPARPLVWDDSEIVVMATKAVIDGKEIAVEHPMDGAGYMGGFGGRGGFNGPRGGRGGMMGRRF